MAEWMGGSGDALDAAAKDDPAAAALVAALDAATTNDTAGSFWDSAQAPPKP